MRKVVASLFITLDGVVEAPNEWSFEHFDEGMMAAMQTQLAQLDTVLLGRVTYEEWVGYWPTATDEPFASFINYVPKFVVSTTLKRVDWQNATLISGDTADAIRQLKQQPGKTIGVAGSPGLVRSLLQADLLDVLYLQFYPVIAGHGKRLFEAGGELKRMRLTASEISPTGVAIMTYAPRR
jgi:dihydrofolate reductase